MYRLQAQLTILTPLKALVRATESTVSQRPHNEMIMSSVIGAVFLGTPFRGSWVTGNMLAEMRISVARHARRSDGETAEYNTELIQYLHITTRDNPGPLDELRQRIVEVLRHDEYKFPTVFFYETRDTKFGSHLKVLPEDKQTETSIDPSGHGIVRKMETTKGRGLFDASLTTLNIGGPGRLSLPGRRGQGWTALPAQYAAQVQHAREPGVPEHLSEAARVRKKL